MAPALRFFKNYFLFFKIIILLIFLNYFNILISKNNFIKKLIYYQIKNFLKNKIYNIPRRLFKCNLPD